MVNSYNDSSTSDSIALSLSTVKEITAEALQTLQSSHNQLFNDFKREAQACAKKTVDEYPSKRYSITQMLTCFLNPSTVKIAATIVNSQLTGQAFFEFINKTIPALASNCTLHEDLQRLHDQYKQLSAAIETQEKRLRVPIKLPSCSIANILSSTVYFRVYQNLDKINVLLSTQKDSIANFIKGIYLK